MMDLTQMSKLMKQMGIKTQNIQAKKVLIETDTATIVVENPNVVEVDMKGQKSYQISGSVRELSYNRDDVKMVMEKAGVDEKKAKELLDRAEGDVAEAIILASE